MKLLEKRHSLTPTESATYQRYLDRHAICCQQALAADYCDFARAEARKIWRQNAPSIASGPRGSRHKGEERALGYYGRNSVTMGKPFFGDDDDAECVGLGALMRSAQIWPPKCPRCEGSGKIFDLMAGVISSCGDCAGSGKPRDERNVFHAYLRLAIRTQVLCELKRRTSEAKQRDRMGKRERSATGNFRAGRGPMRDPSLVAEMGARDRDGTVGEELGLRVWTTSTHSVGLIPTKEPLSSHLRKGLSPENQLPHAAELDLPRYRELVRKVVHASYLEYGVIDVSDATGYDWLRPSDKLRRAYPKRCLQPLALWEKFVEAYKAELRRSMRANVAEWGALLSRRVVVLRCDCSSVERCHRGPLADVLAGTRGVYEGELTSFALQSHEALHVVMQPSLP